MHASRTCACCGSGAISIFYEVRGVPVHCMVLLSSQEEAAGYATGDIALAFCRNCGYISNVAFDSGLVEYASGYEASQAFSPTFSAYQIDLVERLIDRYGLRNKDVIEIGCGQGEFLSLLCGMGGNRGVGFDPAYDSDRDRGGVVSDVTFVKDFYSDEYAHCQADFICCRMTLEHLHNPAELVRTVRRAAAARPGAIVFFQVPDAGRVLRDLAFWDIYYEHCAYFSLGSLARLFRRCGFGIVELAKEYQDQYLVIGGIAESDGRPVLEQENDLATLASDVEYFRDNSQQYLQRWRAILGQNLQAGRKTVIWGAGSKGVAFLNSTNVRGAVEYAVDINPHKQGTYLAGTAQRVVAPAFLSEYKPDLVIVMNPVYCDEIRRSLDELGVAAELMVA